MSYHARYQVAVQDLEAARSVHASEVEELQTECSSLEAEAESLREQLAAHERWIDSYGHPEEWVKRAQAAHGRAEAAEAKLAEEKELRVGTEAAYQDQEKWLGDALDALGIKTVFEIKGAKAKLAEVEKGRDKWRDEYGKCADAAHWELSRLPDLDAIEQARELASGVGKGSPVDRLAEIARLLSGDEKP